MREAGGPGTLVSHGCALLASASPSVPEWRNWQTRGTQNPVRLKPGGGSTPPSGTNVPSTYASGTSLASGTESRRLCVSCAGSRPELGSPRHALGEVRLRNDRKAAINALGLVATQLHCDRARHAGPLHLSHRGATKIVDESARSARQRSRKRGRLRQRKLTVYGIGANPRALRGDEQGLIASGQVLDEDGFAASRTTRLAFRPSGQHRRAVRAGRSICTARGVWVPGSLTADFRIF